MKLLYVEVKNFLSIGYLRLDFADSGLMLMDGWNYDDDSANGAGKTAVFTAIPFSIWDKFPRKITKSEVLRKGTKVGYSKVGIHIDGDTYECIRHRPSKVEFFKNNVLMNMTQEEWEKIIGLSYSQYLICMHSAQTEGKKLLALNDTETKDFILRLMDLERFGNKKKEVDLIIKDLAINRIEKETEIAKIDSKIEVYNEQLIDMDLIHHTIAQLDYSDLDKKIKVYQAVQRPDVSKYTDLKKKITEKQNTLTLQQNDKTIITTKLNMTKKELETIDIDKIVCPDCSADIVPGYTVDNRKKYLKERISALTEKSSSYPDFRKMKEELDAILQKASKAQSKEEDVFIKSQQLLADAQNVKNIRKTKIAGLKKQLDDSLGMFQKIKQLELNKDLIAKELAVIVNEIEIWKTVSMTLAPTGAPAYIMDAVVDVFNEKISDYTSEIWPGASYRIQSFKEDSTGGIKAKFSDKLVIAGRDRSVGSLSGGEYKCLSLAVDFAIIDVIESMFGTFMSPIILDEPFEGLDASNRERAIALLEKKAQTRQIWVIDHMSESKSSFSTVVRIEKRNGTSSLVI